MIQPGTLVNVSDNSGAKVALIIRSLGGSNRKVSRIGDLVVCAIKKAIPNGNVKSGQVVKAVVVRSRQRLRRSDGTYIAFSDNAVVLVKNDFSLYGTRVFGTIAREVKIANYNPKISSLAPEVL